MPPFALTQSKYAFAMFGMSVKSVPGCFVAIAPSLIGVPVAFLPLPRPQTLLTAEAFPWPTFSDELELAAVVNTAAAATATGIANARVALPNLIPLPPFERSPLLE